MELDFVLDPSGFPMVKAATMPFYIQWMPITKIQIETFVLSNINPAFNEAWYSELLSYNPRVSASKIDTTNYWNAIVTGILPKEAQSYATWNGSEYDLPTVEEWHSAFELFNHNLYGDKISKIIVSLDGISPRASLLVKNLEKIIHNLKSSAEVMTIADQMMMRLGVMEYVYEDNKRQTFAGLGQTNKIFFGTTASPHKGVPQRLVNPSEGARMPHFGFRLIRRVNNEDRNPILTYPEAISKATFIDANLEDSGAIPEIATVKTNAVFISYNRIDWKKYVNPLIERLRSVGISVWVDQHVIEGGDDWMDEINKALKICNRMILCVSPEALESSYVKLEYRYFIKRNKKLFPLICRESELPPELEGIQYYNFNQLDRLIEKLKK